jgi:quinol monooxygenase YgiN
VGFAVLERRLRPGATASYVAAIAELCRALSRAPGLIATTTYLSDDDPPVALNVAEWRSQIDHHAARRAAPAAVEGAPAALAAPGGEGWVWFEQRYLARDIGAQVGLCAATRYALAPGQAQAYLEWAAAGAREGMVEGRLAGLLLLERADASGQFLAIEEFTDEAARVEHRRRQGALDRGPFPVELAGAFSGATAFYWPGGGEVGGK